MGYALSSDYRNTVSTWKYPDNAVFGPNFRLLCEVEEQAAARDVTLIGSIISTFLDA